MRQHDSSEATSTIASSRKLHYSSSPTANSVPASSESISPGSNHDFDAIEDTCGKVATAASIATSHNFMDGPLHSVLELDGADPLRCLVEAACASKSRTPKRVSMSPNETKCHPPLPTEAVPRRVSTETLHNTADGENTVEQEQSQHYPSHNEGCNSNVPRKSFEERYSELVFFKKRFGHCNVLTTGDYKGLGEWLSNQRRRFLDGNVPEGEASLLRELECPGFGATPTNKENSLPNDTASYSNPYSSAHIGYHRHVQPPPPHYHQQLNPSLPPPSARSYHLNPPLTSQHEGRVPLSDLHGISQHPIRNLTDPPSTLRSFAPPRLPSSGHPYASSAAASRDTDHAKWVYRLHQLGSFRAQYGHSNVSTVSVQTNKREHQDLCLWLASLRNMHRKGQLHRDRAHILHTHFDCPGFEPIAPSKDFSLSEVSADNATSSYLHRQQHPTLHQHHKQQPTGNTPSSMHLCDVLHAQRVYRDQCKEQSDVEQARMTGSAPVPPTIKPARKRGQYIGWHERLEQLHLFKKLNGHTDCRIMMHDQHKDLGRWLASQRHQFRKGKLPQEKADILINMGVTLVIKKPQCYRTGLDRNQNIAGSNANAIANQQQACVSEASMKIDDLEGGALMSEPTAL